MIIIIYVRNLYFILMIDRVFIIETNIIIKNQIQHFHKVFFFFFLIYRSKFINSSIFSINLTIIYRYVLNFRIYEVILSDTNSILPYF